MYLGGFDSEPQAALAYDLAAVKFRGMAAQTNFSLESYDMEIQMGQHVREGGGRGGWGVRGVRGRGGGGGVKWRYRWDNM